MLIEPLIAQLTELHLIGMARTFEQIAHHAAFQALAFDERLAQLLQSELAYRQHQRLSQRLRWARLPQLATVEDLDTRTPRGLDKRLSTKLIALDWLDSHLNILITGPTGIGKSFLSAALAHQACRRDISTRYYRLPRLAEELNRAQALHKKSAFFKQLARVKLLVLDDFGLTPLADDTKRDLLEIMDDRYNKASTLITSQLPVEKWHVYLNDPTLADAILDRLIHNAYRVNLKGESMRAKQAAPIDESNPNT
jgi:DNA replication protein DnaC